MSYTFTSHTTGNIEATEKNIYYAFLEEESVDIMGNIYVLSFQENESLSSISGYKMEGFSLTYTNPQGANFDYPESLKANEVADYFAKFLRGERDWIQGFDQRPYLKNRWPSFFFCLFLIVLILFFFAYHVNFILH